MNRHYLLVAQLVVDNELADATPDTIAQRVTDAFARSPYLPNVVLADPIARRGQVRVVELTNCLDILPTMIGDILNLHERKR